MVKDTERHNPGIFFKSLLHKVVLPHPEGAETTKMVPNRRVPEEILKEEFTFGIPVFFLVLAIGILCYRVSKSPGYGFWLSAG